MLNIIFLGLCSLFTDIATEMVYPLIPLYLTLRLGATPAIVGLIEGIAESLASLLKVLSGYLSDRIRQRKPLAIFGYSVSVLGRVVLYLSNTWLMVFSARIIDRFGKGVRTAPRDALIADSIKESKRGESYGLHRAMDTLGAAIGVFLAFLFIRQNPNNYSQIFLLSIIVAIVGIAFLFFTRERIQRDSSGSAEARPRLDAKSEARNTKLIQSWRLLPKKLKIFLLFVFLFALGNSSNQFLILRAKNLGFSVPMVLLLYLFYNLVYGFFSYPSGRLSDKISQKPLLVSGYLIYGLVYLGFAFVPNPVYLWLLFGIYGLYSAFTEGIEKALVSNLAPDNLRGTSIGLHATLVGIGLLPASLFAGLLWNLFGPSAPFYFGGLLGIIAGIGLFLIL